ncbi:MAG TPA: hypothetical protein VFI66_06370 [Gemmatimonadales bacterium]|nr:hypothetical protein [Gemmatimonadales bacterium]
MSASAWMATAVADTGQRRPRAVEYSNLYSVRLTIHRYASYATIPLFVAEYALGRSLYNTPPDSVSHSVRSAHGLVAVGIAGLFGINTVTGGWNLWDSRKDPAGRARRYVHAALMLASDAGFVATGALAPSRRQELAGTIDPNRRSLHRTVAMASMGTALAGYAMMLIWKH